jgi:hypothetical protein
VAHPKGLPPMILAGPTGLLFHPTAASGGLPVWRTWGATIKTEGKLFLALTEPRPKRGPFGPLEMGRG